MHNNTLAKKYPAGTIYIISCVSQSLTSKFQNYCAFTAPDCVCKGEVKFLPTHIKTA